jgi:hypothetical protein
MARFPVDAPKRRVLKTLEHLGFRLVREAEHIAMVRDDPGWNTHAADHAESPPDQRLDAEDHLHSGRHLPS